MMDLNLILTASERKALAHAANVARRTKDRPVLATVAVGHDGGWITDSYIAVRLPFLAPQGMGEGTRLVLDAEALYRACKGAGSDGVALTLGADGATARQGRIQDDGDGLYILDGGPTFPVPYFDAGHSGMNYPELSSIYNPAVASVFGEGASAPWRPVEGYSVSDVPALTAERITDVVGCLPAAHHAGRRGARAIRDPKAPLRIYPQPGDSSTLKPAVIVNGSPFAVVMPVRDR